MTDISEERLALAERIDPELLQMLARMSRRQQRQVLLMRERRAKEDLEERPPGRPDPGDSSERHRASRAIKQFFPGMEFNLERTCRRRL
jgi:hypothetical protein